jgi:hypothetical protein
MPEGGPIIQNQLAFVDLVGNEANFADDGGIKKLTLRKDKYEDLGSPQTVQVQVTAV